MAQQDTHRQALERFKDAQEAVSESYGRMREDLRFSNPADPQQWDDTARQMRKGRPCLTFDRTNQFIAQVVNSARQNKPSIHVMPVDSDADTAVAEKLSGIIRHIEYVSRAGITYDTAIESAARIGLGWMRVVPEIMRPDTNEQEIRIKRLHDPLAAYLEAGWTEPDGSDAKHGFVETLMSKAAFKAAYPKAMAQSWEGQSTGSDWFGDQVRVCEYFCINEKDTNHIIIEIEGDQKTLTEDEYWGLAKQIGYSPPVASTFTGKQRTVKWYKLSGAEVLDETDFPSQFLPLIPVIGHEVWIGDKRYLCGMTRRLMDGQRAYNYERSAFIESVAMQPKAPYMAAVESMEGLEDAWDNLNQGNPAVLPFNHLDSQGNPMPAPQRQMPPALPATFAQGGQMATQDMEASVGMFRANLGQPGAAVSGRAKREDKVQGDTANFHYTDNLSRSIEQLGRIVVDMIPRIYDTKRQARIYGEDGSHDFVQIDPNQPKAASRQMVRGQDGQPKEGKKIVSINPNVGSYDVRVKTGPAYTTLREESAEQLANLIQASPGLMPILGDLWVKMQDWPESEKAAKRLQAMLPPQIQEMESEEGEEIPPEAQAKMGQMQQQIQELSQALEKAHAEHVQLEQDVQSRMSVEQMKAQSTASLEQAKHQREIQFEMVKATQAKEDAEMKLQIARESNASAERIAELNAKVALAKLQTDVAQANMARAAEQALQSRAEEQALQSYPGAEKLEMLHQALQKMTKPAKRRMSITAPSGAIYHGEIQDDEPPQPNEAI